MQNIITDILFDFDKTLSPGPIQGYLPIELLREKFQISSSQAAKLKELDFDMLKEFYFPEVSMHITNLEEERELHQKVYSIMAERAGITDVNEFTEFMVEYRMNKLEFGLYPEVEEAIKELSKKYKLHVFTNALPSRIKEVEKTSISKFFENIFISNLVGFYKPQKDFFHFALKKINKNPEEVLFLDDKESFLISATEVGISVALVDRDEKYPQSKVRKIKSLTEIMD